MRQALRALAAVSLLWSTSAYPEVKLVPGRVAPLDIVGEPAGFDPKSDQVFIQRTRTQKSAPVLLYIHGGGGFTPGEQKVPEFFRSFGFATVAFDAFKLNKIGGLSSQELSTKLSLTGKQQMLTPVASQALDWILKQDWADAERVYIYGHSNGARVALAMAGQVDPKNVRLVFADAPANCCIALPDTLNVPVKLLFGDKDNYGGTGPDDLLYERRNPMTGESIKQWSQKHLTTGKLEVKFYDGGHGQFLGKGIPAVRVRGAEWRLGGDAERWKMDIKTWTAK